MQINTILIDNQVTSETLHTTDRVPALLELRVATLGSTLVENANSSSSSLDIHSHTKSFKRKKLSSKLFTHTINQGNFTIACEVPTLELDNRINNDCIRAISDKLQSEEGLTESVGEVFVFEIIKYISSVTFNDTEGESHNIIFSQLNTRQKINVFERLPMMVSVGVSDYITKIREFENKFLQIKAKSDDTSAEPEVIDIDFSPGLFNVE
jgi:hypothetical protein